MKNQRMKTNQSTGFSMMLVVLTVIMLIGCFAVTTFAANGNVNVDLNADLNIGLTMGNDGIYCKEYDGTTSANVTAKATNVTVVNAQFDSADVATATKVVIQLIKDGENATVEIPAKITPKTLTWGNGTATATSPYLANTTLYSGLAVSNLPDLYNGTAKVEGAIVVGQVAIGTPQIGIVGGMGLRKGYAKLGGMIADEIDLTLPIVCTQLTFRAIGIAEVEVDHIEAALSTHADRVNQGRVASVTTLGENSG
jgi:hypothetical protein